MAIDTDLLVTVADIEDLPEDGNRYEVIEGVLYVSTAPGFRHQSVLAKLFSKLDHYLEGQQVGRLVWGVGIVFDEISGVVPDLVFVTHDRLKRILNDGRLTGPPEIVIEALSPGKANEKRDRVVKRDLYSKWGVSEYWILDLESQTTEIYRKRKTGGLQRAIVLQAEDELTSPLLPGFRVEVAGLFE
jgi:Uma2 family endonuclease